MSTSNQNEQAQELRQRKSTTDSASKEQQDEEDKNLVLNKEENDKEEEEKENEEIIIIPSHESNISEPGPLSKDKLVSLIIVLFSVFLDFLGMSLIQPILPFYAEKFNASSTQLGALYSAYSGMSLLASLFMGVGSDKFGRKPMILFSLFGTMTGYLCTGLANSYGELLGYRFLTGFFGASSPVAFAVIADLVPSKDRSKWITLVGTMLTVAFIVGPGLGSGLSVFGIRVPFFVSSGIGAFGLIVAAIFMRESHPEILRKRRYAKKKDVQRVATVEQKEELSPSSPGTDTELAGMDNIKIINEKDRVVGTDNDIDSKIPIQFWIICAVAMFSGLSTSVYTSMMALYLIDTFGLDAVAVGYVSLTTAFIGTLANIIFLIFSSKFGLYITTICGSLYFGAALVTMPNINTLWPFLGVVAFGVGIGFGLQIPAYNAIAVSLSNIKTRGRISGIISAAGSVAGIIGPILHGVLYGIDNKYPFYFGSACCLIGAVIITSMVCKWPQYRRPKKTKTDDDDEINTDKKDWKFVADKVQRKDYMKLGKALGVILSQKHYKWVEHFDPIIEHLDIMFPPLSTDSFSSYLADIKYLQQSATNTRNEYDSLHILHDAIENAAQITG